MGQTCCTKERDSSLVFTTTVVTEKGNPKNSLRPKQHSTRTNAIRSIAVHRSKLPGQIQQSASSGSHANNDEDNKRSKQSSEKALDSLNRSITIFKVEPGTFRIEKDKAVLTGKYEVDSIIGEGSFGQVKKLRDNSTGECRALKIIEKKMCQLTDDFSEEIDIIKKLDHPNVVRFYEFFQDDTYYFLVTEFCEGGDLHKHIRDRGRFTEEEAAKIFMQLFSAISFCHSFNIVHRDLKPENIVFETTSLDSTIKVIDFGRGKILKPKETMINKAGSLHYIAPEIWLGKEYNEKIDIWSAGVILYLLLAGALPFDSESKEETKKQIIEGEVDFSHPLWITISSEVKSFILRLLQVDPKKRISAAEALKDPWIQKHNKPLEMQTIILKQFIDNLIAFKTQMTFQKAVLSYMASQQLSRAEEQKLQEGFKLLDQNNDGVISLEELQRGYCTVYEDAPNAKKEAERIMKRIDLNKNGFIDYNEFLMANLELESVVSKKKLEQAFDFFDVNKDGSITIEELRTNFRSICTEEIIAKILSEVDADKNGKISFAEFSLMMETYQLTNSSLRHEKSALRKSTFACKQVGGENAATP